MNGLRLDVERLTVELATLDGYKEQTSFFVPVADGVRSPTDALGDELDDPSLEFLPCRIAGQTTLIRLEWIAYVGLDADPPAWHELEEVGAVANQVELDLVTGEQLTGTLLTEGAEYSCRVSDHLNRPTGRFLLLHTRTGALYVNRRAIARVRLEERG